MTGNLDTILRRFESPDEVREFDKGTLELVGIAGQVIGRATYQPGWKWSLHVGRLTGRRRCEVEHLGLVLAGHATAAFDDGRIFDHAAGTLFYIPPEPHDSWVVASSVHAGGHDEAHGQRPERLCRGAGSSAPLDSAAGAAVR